MGDIKVGLIDADLLDRGTKFPNLAIMKLSGYHKAKGDEVHLLECYNTLSDYDIIYISKVFTKTKVPKFVLDMSNVIIGGTGFFLEKANNLPPEIEHHMPDYHIYDNYIEKRVADGAKKSYYKDYLDYSIGFTTRGCFRKCDFCVNRRYNKSQKHSPISEFFDENKKGIILCDDNFLACSEWEEILDDIIATNKPFQFRQGLDIRLLTNRKAQKLSSLKYHGDFIFAFDYIRDRDIIEEKLSIWRKYSNKSTKLYILCAFESQDEIDINNIFERINILSKYKCLPYLMRYESYNISKYRGMYIGLARWCNQPNLFKKKSFREFCELNQKQIKTNGKICSSMKSLLEFEKNNPEIAEKWFDIKFWV